MTEEMFGQYRLDELIGRGGMGEVYRAFDTVRDRAVAIKRLPARLAADAEFDARFRAEAALVARLREPHIIPIHDYGEIDGSLFIDMRLVEGPDLGTLLAEHGPLDGRRAASILTQVGAALDVAHAENLVHRDIKPGNILITPGGDAGDGDFAYVADFGIARAVSGGATSLTATGATVGSLDYMAPERFGDGHGDHRVDVYSLGCLLYEMLTGRRPFPVEGLPAMINAHLNTPPPRPSAHVPGLPAGLDAVVAMAMAKDPHDRYPSAGACAAAARAAVDASAVDGAAVDGVATEGAAAAAVAGPGAGIEGQTMRIAGPAMAAATSASSPPSSFATAGSVAGPSSDSGRRRGARRGVVVLAAVAAILAVVGGGFLALGFADQADPSQVRADAVRTPGDNPFMPPVGDDRLGVTPPPGSGGSFNGGTSGLYGGTLNNAACDPDAMVAFLESHPDKAEAWADVQGIARPDIPRYVGGLTPVILRADTVVTNHGFAGGRATVVPTVLQAGTAVLIDTYGVPRARCFCGNPLTPATRIPTPRYVGNTWAGFSPAAVTTVAPAATPIAEFTLVDPSTNEVFLRTAGSRGAGDRPAAPATTDPTLPFTPDPTTQAPQPLPPATVQPGNSRVVPPVTPQPPAAPSGLTAKPVGPNAVELRWTDNSAGAATFEATDGTRGRSVQSGTTYTWSGLEPNFTTCFRVTAFNGAGASAPSNEACATTVPAEEPSYTVTVDSRAGWVGTPLRLSGGEQYRVSYESGTWNVDYRNLDYVGPGGYSDSADAQIYQPCKTVQTNYAVLLASTGGSVSAVGGGGTFTAGGSGTLQLRINDNCPDDNDGAVTVIVQKVA